MLTSYYEILGVSENASDDEIRKAYRKKAKLYHPDINKAPDAHGKFLLLTTAYDILINKDKKLYYKYNSGFTGKDPMQEYEEKRRAQQAKEDLEERLIYEAFLREKAKLRNSRLYYPSMIYTYVKAAAGFLLSLLILFLCLLVIIKVHLILFFFLLPFISLSIYIFKSTLNWLNIKKRYFQ